jgi:hypothetical protein
MAKTTVEHIKDFRNGLSLFIILIIAERKGHPPATGSELQRGSYGLKRS